MTMLYVTLDRIRPNPWQPRLRVHPDHIEKLAADIASRYDSRQPTHGLLQLPAGRPLGADGAPLIDVDLSSLRKQVAVAWPPDLFIQLAYGHSRFEAFRQLAQQDARFHRMPIEIVTFNDSEMASAAWAENEARRDLTAIEEARFIQRLRTDFGWSQARIAEQLGLNASTVSNKLALLRLPEVIREQLLEGTLSERQAQALLPLYELPLRIIAGLEHVKVWITPALGSTLGDLPALAAQLSSDQLRGFVTSAIRAATIDIPKDLLHARVEGATVQNPVCNDCPLMIKMGKDRRCGDRACLDTKQDICRAQQLVSASEATGLAAAPANLHYSEYTDFHFGPQTLAPILETRCPNLRIVPGERWGSSQMEGWPKDVHPICVHGKGKKCRCELAARKQAQQSDPRHQEQAAAQKAIATELLTPLRAHVRQGLEEQKIGAWLAVLWFLDRQTWERLKKKDADIATVMDAIASALISRDVYTGSTVEYATQGAQRFCSRFGLELPEVLRAKEASVESCTPAEQEVIVEAVA